MNRKQIMSLIENALEQEEYTHESVMDAMKEIIDEIESKVNQAKELIDTITGVDDLDHVNDALDVLKDLSKDLY